MSLVQRLDWPDRLVCWRCMTFVETSGHSALLLSLMEKKHATCRFVDVESGEVLAPVPAHGPASDGGAVEEG